MKYRKIMDQITLHRLIQEHLERMRDLHRGMQNHTGSIPSSEIDRFLAELRGTYELALTLYHRNAIRSMDDLEAVIGNRYTAESGPLREIEQRAGERMMGSFNIPKETLPEVVPTKEPVAETPVPTPETVAVTPSTQHISSDQLMADAMMRAEELQSRATRDLNEKFEEQPTLADRFEEKTTLAERIAPSNSSARVAEKMQRKPIRDLKAAIGINERFLFINHLFAGDSNEYHKAIDTVNAAADFQTARKFVEEQLIARYKWNLSGDPADAFMDLLERRFLA